MSGHNYLGQVKDPAAAKALEYTMGLITKLTARITTLEAQALQNQTTLQANGQRLTNLSDGVGPTDAVTVAQMQQTIAALVETF